MRKYCNSCKVLLTSDNKVSGTRSKCKPCYAQHMKEYYKKNPDKYSVHKNKYVKNNDAIWKSKVEAYIAQKISSGCIDCGIMNPVVLDLDHRNPSEKQYSISELRSRKVKIEELVAELEKCDVVCANCHRIRTANTFGNWRLHLPEINSESG